jgi:hypothetical protein
MNKAKRLIAEQELGDHQFPKEKDRTWNQGKLEKRTEHRDGASSYVTCAIFTALKHKHNCNDHREGND